MEEPLSSNFGHTHCCQIERISSWVHLSKLKLLPPETPQVTTEEKITSVSQWKTWDTYPKERPHQKVVCVIPNTTCCPWINATGQAEVNIKEINACTEWLHNFGRGDIASTGGPRLKEAFPKLIWFLPFLGSLMAIVVDLFSPCLTFCLSLHLSGSSSLK